MLTLQQLRDSINIGLQQNNTGLTVVIGGASAITFSVDHTEAGDGSFIIVLKPNPGEPKAG